MRNPNGYGSVKKLKGNRRRPYIAVTPAVYDIKPKKDISFLKDALPEDLYNKVQEYYDSYYESEIQKVKPSQKAIGYYENREDAMIALADYNKNPYDIDKRNTTFEQVYEILYEEKFSKMKPQAQTSYVSANNKCNSIKNMRMTEIRKTHMQRIVDEHSDKSKSTQANLLKLFHAVFNFALESDICEKDYSQFVEITSEKQTKKKNPFTRDEIQILWDNMTDDNWIDSILIQIHTGMRITEVLTLSKKDIHLDERYIELHGTKTNAAERIVPIHKKIAPLLEKRLMCDCEYIFHNSRKKPIIYNSYLRKYFNPAMKLFDVKHGTHDCRHAFASFAASSELNPILVKKIIGHNAQDITQDVYTHAYIEDLIREIDKLDI